MKTILLLGLFLLPEAHFKQIRPDCGATHCQITVEEAQAIEAFTRDAIGSVQMLMAQRCEART